MVADGKSEGGNFLLEKRVGMMALPTTLRIPIGALTQT